MPHISVKIIAGRSERQKKMPGDQVVNDVMNIAGCDEKSVSVSIIEIDQEDWPEDVCKHEILSNWSTLYNKPGYNPLK